MKSVWCAVAVLVSSVAFAQKSTDITVDDVSVSSSVKSTPSSTVSSSSSSNPTENQVGQAWTAVGGKTLAPGANLLQGDLGYPELSVTFLRGLAPGINLGGRIGFVWGVEGILRETAPGFKAQALLKVRFLDSGQISIGMTFEPGFFSYSSYLQGARVGLALPVGFKLGISASSALAIGIHVDFPMWVEFGQFGGFNLPILTGGGAEYFLTSEFAVFVRARIGPTIRTLRPAELTFDAAAGVGWRF